eukprot:GHRQ01023224.1.p3 GENE.GHRQ01023224.1~~GHRQ01023224.1.p3  ORF type:complete len:104 (+),score=7.11 GHRQ01023224.1:667-978(+)
MPQHGRHKRHHVMATMRARYLSMLLAVSTISMSGRSAALVKGQRPLSASTAFQVARPITCPAGLSAGFTSGSSVTGSSRPEATAGWRRGAAGGGVGWPAAAGR